MAKVHRFHPVKVLRCYLYDVVIVHIKEFRRVVSGSNVYFPICETKIKLLRIGSIFSHAENLQNKRTVEPCTDMNNPILCQSQFHFIFFILIMLTKPPLLIKILIKPPKILALKKLLNSLYKLDSPGQ